MPLIPTHDHILEQGILRILLSDRGRKSCHRFHQETVFFVLLKLTDS